MVAIPPPGAVEEQRSRGADDLPVAPPRPRSAWSSYAAGSEINHFAKFCREHLIQSEDRWEGKPLVLEPWQRRML